MFSADFIDALAEAVAARVAAEIDENHAASTRRLLTVREAALYIGRSPKAIEHLIARGTIPVTKLDGKRQIDRATLDKLISDRTYFEA